MTLGRWLFHVVVFMMKNKKKKNSPKPGVLVKSLGCFASRRLVGLLGFSGVLFLGLQL